MTATEVFESVSNGGVSDFSALVDVLNQHGLWNDPRHRLSKRKKDELDLIRIGGKYPELRELMPRVINEQLEQS